MTLTTIVKQVELTASQEHILHYTLKKLLMSATKTGSGKRITDSLRFELEEDQYEELLHIFAQL